MESLIGPVPDGWRQVPLGAEFDIVAGVSGGRIPLDEDESAIRLVSPKDLRDNRIVGSSGGVSEAAAGELTRYRLAPGDVVCSRTGNLGRQALVTDAEDGWLPGSACFRLRAHTVTSAAYLVHYLGHPAVQGWIVGNATGSTVPSMSVKVLAALPLVLPPAPVQTLVTEVMTAVDDTIDVHRRIIDRAEELRKSLLPVLLSGRTSDTEP